MSILVSIFLVITALSILMAIRNEIVYKARMRALALTSIAAIEAGKDWEDAYKIYHQCGSYYAQLFNLTKWTFKQFYPVFNDGDVKKSD